MMSAGRFLSVAFGLILAAGCFYAFVALFTQGVGWIDGQGLAFIAMAALAGFVALCMIAAGFSSDGPRGKDSDQDGQPPSTKP